MARRGTERRASRSSRADAFNAVDNRDATHLDTAPTLQVRQHLGLATTAGSDGVDRVLFIDIGSVSVVAKAADTKPDDNKVEPANSTTVDASGAPGKIVFPGASLLPGPTEKSRGTVVGSDATSISLSVVDATGQERTFAVDLASTVFYAGDTQCVPGALAVGAEIASPTTSTMPAPSSAMP